MPLDIQIILLIFGSGLFMGLFFGALFALAIVGRQTAEAGMDIELNNHPVSWPDGKKRPVMLRRMCQ